MPSCSVRSCKNNTTKHKKYQGITFHRFPAVNEAWKAEWINIIRESRCEDNWKPTETSVICSVHFCKDDIYTTKNGLRRIVDYAVPKRLLLDHAELDEQSLEPENNGSFERICQQSKCSIIPPSTCSLLVQTPQIITTLATDSQQLLLSGISASLNQGLCLSQHSSVIRPSSAEETPKNKPSLLFHTPRKRRLKDILKKKQTVIDTLKKKIKLLQQNIRRLTSRNTSLKNILQTVKVQDYVDTDLYKKLSVNIITTDLCNKYHKKKFKKKT